MAKDIYHNLVKEALIKEGWTITHDPFYLPIGLGTKKLEADLGAEKFFAAQKNTEKILVGVKSFITSSNINELHKSVGQFDFYALLIEGIEPERVPYLAMPEDAFEDLIREPIVQTFLKRHHVNIITYHTTTHEICQWIKF
jgi:hypothetical protein